jgi:hypothetical protein
VKKGDHRDLIRRSLRLALGALLCAPAAQAELEYGVDVGAGYSDNVYRRADEEIESKIVTAGLDLDWEEARRRLNADVSADLTYNHYLEDGIDDHLAGNANGQISFGIIPERFTWLVQDTFGQTQQDPLVPATPESLEFINYLTTGPNLTLRLGGSNALQLSGRYSLATYEESPFDNTRAGGSAAFIRDLSEHSNVSLNARYEDVDYDEAGNVDFQMRSASAIYTLQGARTDIDAELGYSWIDRDTTANSELTGPLVRIEIRRNIAQSSYLSLRFGTQLADAAEAMRSGAGVIDIGVEPGVGTASSATFENKFATLSWQLDRPRTSIDISANWDKDEYDTQASLNRDRLMFGAAVTRHLSNQLRARARAYFSTEDYALDDSTSDEIRLMFGVAWNFGRNVGLDFFAERLDRDSNTTAGGGQSVENRLFLTVFYRPASANSDR